MSKFSHGFVLVRLMGGLGNQMFQYACALSLSKKLNTPLKFDLGLLGEPSKKVDNHVLRFFDLDVFPISASKASAHEVERINGKENPTLLNRLSFKWSRLRNSSDLILQDQHRYQVFKDSYDGRDVCIVGRWQSERYFYEFSDIIRNEFSWGKFEPNEYTRGLLDDLRGHTLVAVQVRRGDYVTHPVYSKTLGALSSQYYLEAMKYLETRLGNSNRLNFLFISDDIEWCKKKFSNHGNTIFVDQEKSKNGFVSDMWLMSKCDHMIIANSTFAWWGAWLGEKNYSIIVSPKIWSRDEKMRPEFIVPQRWVQIPNQFE